MAQRTDLIFLSTRALVRERARAQRAEARGRSGAAEMRARIERELERRRAARLSRAGGRLAFGDVAPGVSGSAAGWSAPIARQTDPLRRRGRTSSG